MGIGLGGIDGSFPALFGIVFLLVIATFVVTLVCGVSRWHKNNHAPMLTVEASVVAKRTEISRHTQQTGGDISMMHTTSSTVYFVTFQVESGDRIELRVSRGAYGMLTQGDCGRLTFQDTRYQGFQRA